MDMGQVGLAGYRIRTIFNHSLTRTLGSSPSLGLLPSHLLFNMYGWGIPFQVSFVGLARASSCCLGTPSFIGKLKNFVVGGIEYGV